MKIPEFGQLKYRVEDGTAWIQLHRPEVLNCFSSQLYGEIRDATRVAELDDSVDTIVYTGTGRAFATGGDLKEVRAHLPDDPLGLFPFVDNLPWTTVRQSEKVTIAAVNGLCMAGGLILSLCADMVVASDQAVFAVPEARHGLSEPWTVHLLLPRIGSARLFELMFTARNFSAEEAKSMGMINRVVPHETLEQAAKDLVQEVRGTSAAGRNAYKAYVNLEIGPLPDFDGTKFLLKSPDALALLTTFRDRHAKK